MKLGKVKRCLKHLVGQMTGWRHSRFGLPDPSGGLSRAELINQIIRLVNGTKYLEIGVNTPKQPGYSRDSIVADLVHGVDPNTDTEAEFQMTSDEFFSNHCTETYDVIFVDGLHLFEQAYKDIVNALAALSERGVVIVHDTRPTSRQTSTRSQGTSGKWHGDVWRAILFLRLTHPDLAVLTVDTDEGCTLIFRGNGVSLPIQLDDDLFSWKNFTLNYERILNLVEVEDYLEGLSASQS